MRASGLSLRDLARSLSMTTSADAPSLTPGALPAVTVPSFLKAGFSAASVSTVVSGRIPSSRSTTVEWPFFWGISIGNISSRNAPSAVARAALA
jgi:hypothetical protein